MLLTTSLLKAQEKGIAFYVVAHQDDWQLFMGANVFNDINSFSEKGPFPSGKKVVIIHTTAGNLDDNDDTTPCHCINPFDTNVKRMEYWKVREAGVKNSIHLAACRRDGWGPSLPYPKDEQVEINGHTVTRSKFKNTVSYFLRTKTGKFDAWQSNDEAAVGTMDSSTTYRNWSDFVTTIYYIYKAEIDSVDCKGTPHIEFNVQDIDPRSNLNDHSEHYEAGRAGFEAARMLSNITGMSYDISLFVGYNSQNMPENIKQPDAQNEAGLAAAYCMALLDYNAWPEWGPLFYEWTSRNYYRTISTKQNALGNTDVCSQDELTSPKAYIYPNPADKVLNIQINIPLNNNLDVSICDPLGHIIYTNSFPFIADNTFSINTSGLANGMYLLNLSSGGYKIFTPMFHVIH